MKYCLLLILLVPSLVHSKTSQCYGTTANGSITHSVKLPSKGGNFVIYHNLGALLGRNYVHSKVAEVILNSYQDLHKNYPDIKFKYAETGWKNGGVFKPHKTHQNGLSVDFMVPVKDKQGKSVNLPTTLSNKFGYSIEFNSKGEFQELSIDYESLALHLVVLDKQAKLLGISIRRVIFAPELRQQLYKTKSAKYLQENVVFMKNKAWVRHDEHYHIDFDIICKN